MAGRLYLLADIKPVNYKVEPRGLFSIGFTSGVSDEIARIDALIEREHNFAIIPDHSKVRLVGRIRKEREMAEAKIAIYLFIVDEIVAPREVMKTSITESEGIDA